MSFRVFRGYKAVSIPRVARTTHLNPVREAREAHEKIKLFIDLLGSAPG